MIELQRHPNNVVIVNTNSEIILADGLSGNSTLNVINTVLLPPESVEDSLTWAVDEHDLGIINPLNNPPNNPNNPV